MKTRGIITAAAVVLASAAQSFAIEGLQISVQCSNVVLSWPSQNGESYIVQYRPDLVSTNPWITLTNYMPPDDGTNITIFVHSNVVKYAHCGVGGGPAAMAGGAAASAPIWASEPVAKRMDGSGGVVPVTIFPPGFEFSNYVLYDPSTGEWISGQGITRGWPSAESNTLAGAGPVQLGPLGDNPPPPHPSPLPTETGFYKVVRNGVWLFALTNDTVLSGVVKIPVEAEYDSGTLMNMSLTANGSPIPGTPPISQWVLPALDVLPAISNAPALQLIFTVDTRRLSNGDYYFQAGGLWSWQTTNSSGVPYAHVYSPPVYVHVTNSISFPDWVQEFRDDLMLINVTSTKTNCDWQLDIYGQAGDYVRSFTNHSDDGLIAVSWDLRDTNGNPRVDSTFTTVTRILDPDTATNPPSIRVVDNYPDTGKWIVARANYIPTSARNYNLYVSVENDFAQIGESAGGVLPEAPWRNPGEALFINAMTNLGAFVRAITNHDVRNFYFDGHGSADFIGYFPDVDGRPIPSSAIAKLIGNDVPSTNSIRYRWVWIDSCQSANGDWPQTFGMGNRENVPLTNCVSRPAAFVGFTHEVYGFTYFFHGISEIDVTSINYRSYFQLFWADTGDGLKNAFDQAASFSNDVDDPQYLKIYGYWGLGWNQYNNKTDWPP
jgi:hypothetical protein